MAFQQLDLFHGAGETAVGEAPVIPGLRLVQSIVSDDEERQLIARIDAEHLTPFKFQRWEAKRVTASFGWNYDFTTGTIGAAPPMPDWLLGVRERAAAFARMEPGDLVQVLLIRYDPGAGINWHRDRPVFGNIVGVSLGNEATMRFRRRSDTGFERTNVALARRSAYLLSSEARDRWEHSIAPMDVPRWSLTFRSLAATRG